MLLYIGVAVIVLVIAGYILYKKGVISLGGGKKKEAQISESLASDEKGDKPSMNVEASEEERATRLSRAELMLKKRKDDAKKKKEEEERIEKAKIEEERKIYEMAKKEAEKKAQEEEKALRKQAEADKKEVERLLAQERRMANRKAETERLTSAIKGFVFKNNKEDPDLETASAAFLVRKQFEVEKKVRILIVDDDIEQLQKVKNLALATGATVTVAESAMEALDLTRENFYELIYIAKDLRMMDGIQVSHNMTNTEGGKVKNTIRYALVSEDCDEPTIYFKNEGFVDYIKKPVGEYTFWASMIESLRKENVVSDANFVKEIKVMAGYERKLQNAGIILADGLANHDRNLREFRKAAGDFCDDYQDASKSVMDSLYDKDKVAYMDKVRTLREEARKLGANYLGDMFDDHVNMAKNDDMDVAEMSFRTLELEWEDVVAGLADWLGKKDSMVSATEVLASDTNGLEMSDFDLKIAIKKIEKFISEKKYMDATEELRALREYNLKEHTRLKVEIATRAAESKRYAEVISTLRTIEL